MTGPPVQDRGNAEVVVQGKCYKIASQSTNVRDAGVLCEADENRLMVPLQR